MIVAGTIITLFALSSSIAGWVDRSRPVVAMMFLVIGLAVLAYAHFVLVEGGLSFWDVPHAFVNVAALLLN